MVFSERGRPLQSTSEREERIKIDVRNQDWKRKCSNHGMGVCFVCVMSTSCIRWMGCLDLTTGWDGDGEY